MVPLSLLYTRRNVKGETADEIRQWEKWNLETEGVLLSNTPDQEFPRRQMKAGRTNGLSFLLNVNLKEYFCTSSDSVGFRVIIIHTYYILLFRDVMLKEDQQWDM